MTSKTLNLKIVPMMPNAQPMMVMIPPAMTTAPPLITLLPVTKEKPPLSFISQPLPPTIVKATTYGIKCMLIISALVLLCGTLARVSSSGGGGAGKLPPPPRRGGGV